MISENFLVIVNGETDKENGTWARQLVSDSKILYDMD